MASEGPNAPASGAANDNGGDVAWSDPGNVTADDSSYATAALTASQTTQDLEALDFGFTIPVGATIDGVQVTIVKQGQGVGMGIIEDHTVELGGLLGDNKAQVGAWDIGTDETVSYGGATDTWGLTILVITVNSSGFSAVIRAQETSTTDSDTAAVNYMQVTVWYTDTSGAAGVQIRVARRRRNPITRM